MTDRELPMWRTCIQSEYRLVDKQGKPVKAEAILKEIARLENNLTSVRGSFQGAFDAKNKLETDIKKLKKKPSMGADVTDAVRRLGTSILGFSMNDFEQAGFSQQDIAGSRRENDPVFVIDLAIALLDKKK